jgi:hypothetical protein
MADQQNFIVIDVKYLEIESLTKKITKNGEKKHCQTFVPFPG